MTQSDFVRRIGSNFMVDLTSVQYLDHILCKIPYNDKPFVLREKLNHNIILFWLQLVKSKMESQNYFYCILLTHKKYGKFRYEGFVKSIDDVNEDTYCGLMLPLEVAKQIISEDKSYTLEINIENFKANVNLE